MFHYFLFQFEMRKSILYVTNGVLLATMFLCCRVLVYPYMYWCYARYANIPFLHTPFKIPLFCNSFCLLLFSVQLYWFLIIVRGVLRFFKPSPKLQQKPVSNVNGENGFHYKSD